MPVLESTATISDGKDAIHATAIVGVDLNQKGMQRASTVWLSSLLMLRNTRLGNLFLIDDTADSDATNDHGKNNR